MAKLTYPILVSLDGYIADEDGNFDRAVPDEEVHRFPKHVRLGLELLDERRFGNGMVYLRYRTRL
jgi:hypothetical protein